MNEPRFRFSESDAFHTDVNSHHWIEAEAHSLSVSNDEPLAMQNLSDSQKDELGRLLESYLESLESGLPPTVDSLTRNCPELREALSACVDGLESLHQLAGGVNPPKNPNVEQAPDHDSEQRLGEFVLHEEIGRGGMGVVYLATQDSLNRTVAVKILPMASVLDPRQITRFQHEAEATASLQHPNIVPVFAIGCQRGIHFYAMQYIRGQSLCQWIDAQPIESELPPDWETATSLAADVADGLHAAHEFGVIHRDVKPSNLLLDNAGKVWITDFGLARIQSDQAVTQTGDIVGTTRYMSPEQARGESAIVDGRSDVYSLAATLYEMLTLHPAHEGDDVPSILRAIDENKIDPLRRYRKDLPRDLETVVAKAMSGQRDNRYETAEQFADDLRRVIAGEPTVARPPTMIDRTVRFAARHRQAMMAASLLGLLAVVGFVIGTAKLAAAKQVSDDHAAQSQRNEVIARDAIDRLGNQMAELLSGIPAANSVRHQLLQETLDYYQQFAAAPTIGGTSDRRRSEDLATTLGKMGVLQSELGDRESAIKSLSESESHFQTLVHLHPRDSSLRLTWTISQNNLGEQLAKAGEIEAASGWFTQAIRNQKQMHQDGDADATVELVKSLNNLGGMLSGTENTDAAKEAYEQAIGLLNGKTDQADLRSTIQSNLAGALAEKEPIAASELARESLAHQLKHLESNSNDPKLATQVVVTLNTLAKAQCESLDHPAAVQTLRQAVEIGRQLHMQWPEQLTYRRDLVVSLNALGMSLSALGRFEQANGSLQQAARHGRYLNKTTNDNAEVRSMLAGVLNNLGFLQQQLGDKSAARQSYHEAVQHQEMATNLAPQVARYRKLLQTHRINLDRLGGNS